MNVQYISAQGLRMFTSGLNKTHISLKSSTASTSCYNWADVISELIIGPYFFDVFVIDESYLELLSHWLIPEFDNVGLVNSVICQQNRTPVHHAAHTCAFLNN
jgi:hypothetical protein